MQLNPSPLSDASASVRGAVSLVNQTMGAGDKTFPGAIIGTKATGLSLVMNTDLFTVDATNKTVGIGTATPGAGLDVVFTNPPFALDGINVDLTFNAAFDPLNSRITGTTTAVDYASSVVTTGDIIGHKVNIQSSATHTGDLIGALFEADSAAAANLAAAYFRINGSTATRGYGLFIENTFPAGTVENFQIFSQGRAPGAGSYFGQAAGTDPFVLTDRNFVGIGTASPSRLLYVQASGSSTIYQIGAAFVQTYSGTGVSYNLFNSATRSGGASPPEVVGTDTSMTIAAGSSGTAGLVAAYTGISSRSGGVSAITKMAVYFARTNSASTAAINAAFYSLDQSGAGGTLNAGLYVENFATTGHYPIYYAGTTSKVVVSSTGRFGVGTVTPDSYLHLVGTTGAGTTAHINPGSYAFTGTKYGLLIDPISGGTVFNMAIDYTGASSQFKVYGNARTKVVNSGGLSSDFGGGTMVTAFEANTTTTGVAPTTHAFGTYTATSFTGALGLAGGVYGYNSDMTIAHTAGAVATVAGSNIGIVITADGTIGNLFGHIIGFSRPSGTGAITNQFGVYINPIELATGQKYSIWANGETGGVSSWQVDYRSRMSGWVQDTPNPVAASYTEGFYYGAAHDTNTAIAVTAGGYVDSELFGSNNLTIGANGIWGSIYNAKTGGTVGGASSGYFDFYSDTSAPTYTYVAAIETGYVWNAVPTITTQYGIKLMVVDKGATNYALAYDLAGTKQFLVGGDGVVTYRANTSITAFATGGQASAVALTAEVNFVTTVATAADSVKLPTAVLGKMIVVHNRGANSCDVYPATGGAIDALGANNPFPLAAGTSKEFDGQSATQWYSR